jgi:phosphate transport system substrate-binding protein
LGAEAAYNKSMELVTIKYFTSMTGTLKVGGSTTVQPITQKAADILMARNKGLSVTISAPGSGAGINGAIDGTFHIGAASRELKSSELEKCPDLKQFQIGSDGIAIIINKANKVSNLTKQQVFDIFTGKITNWKDVGGTDSPIFVQTREVGSGTLDAFNELALHIIDKAAKIVSTATPNASNGLVKEAVKGNKNAIGFISFGYLEGSVKGINIEGVSPTPANAMAKVWPYVRPLNVVTKGIPSALAAKFINYLKSDEGQNILVEEHYLPLKAND